MLKRRGWLALALLAAVVAAVHGWLIGRLAPQPPEPGAAPAAVVLAAPSAPAEPPAAVEQPKAPETDPPPAEPPALPKAVPKPAAAPRPAPVSAAAASAAAPAPIPAPSSSEPAVAVADVPVSDTGPADDAPAAQIAAALRPAAALPPPPVYRTRVPAPVKLVYRLSRGLIAGTGELDWRHDGVAYQLTLEAKLPLIGTLITQTSRGRLDAAGLAPERHTDRRIRRSELAANFQRAAGRVSFSNGAAEQPLLAGMQDRLSVMVQLAAIAAGGAQPPPVGQAVRIAVAGARGDVAVWALRFDGVQTVATPDGAVSTWRYHREPDSPHDTRAEYWLDPARGHLPVRVRLTDGSAEPLELLRESP